MKRKWYNSNKLQMKNSVFKFTLMVFIMAFVVEFTAQSFVNDTTAQVSVIAYEDSTESVQNIDAIVDEIIQHIDNRPVGESGKEWAGWIFAGLLLVFNVIGWIMGRFEKPKE